MIAPVTGCPGGGLNNFGKVETMKIRIMMAAMLATLGLSGFILAAGTAAAEERTVIKLHQAPPELNNVDNGPSGRSGGDVMTFEAPLTGDNGLKAVLNGYVVIVDTANAQESSEDRFSHMVFDFGKGSTIVTAGRSSYAPTKTEIAEEAPQVRAVVGGTGDYFAARGQVTTVRHKDGSYDHTIELAK